MDSGTQSARTSDGCCSCWEGALASAIRESGSRDEVGPEAEAREPSARASISNTR